MFFEILAICITVYALFGGYFEAKADVIREQAREKEIENDKKELTHE